MTLAVNEPSDQRMVSELPSYIREDRVEINTLVSGSGIDVTTLVVPLGSTFLTVGVDLAVARLEIVLISGTGASVIEVIRDGVNGQVKIFVFQDNDISFKDGVKLDGKIYLNRLPALSNFDAQQDDVVALVNIGGDGSSEYGYWKELFRLLSVK